ncbi:MAG: hypothetical protein RDV48_04025 [Candidatus Eremiobacteraeota bacterium]|nr:hypothetical protein [Candidatus Eremiobacteraeota bacterium]
MMTTQALAAAPGRKPYALSRIPLICATLLHGEMMPEEVEAYLAIARRELNSDMERFYNRIREASKAYLTIEERSAVKEAELLRDRELIGYHKALRHLERYLKLRKKSCLLHAERLFRDSEEAWERLVRHMKHFCLLNLAGRRFMTIP